MLRREQPSVQKTGNGGDRSEYLLNPLQISFYPQLLDHLGFSMLAGCQPLPQAFKCMVFNHHPLNRSLHKPSQGLNWPSHRELWMDLTCWLNLFFPFLPSPQSITKTPLDQGLACPSVTSMQHSTCLPTLDLTSTAGNTTFTARIKHTTA